MKRPTDQDCDPYYLRYVDLAPKGDVVATLRHQGEETAALLAEIDEARSEQRYAAGKWSIKELVGHVIDTERIFAFRALAIARGDQQPLPGFEQDDYVAGADFGARKFASLVEEFEALRRADVALFGSLQAEALARVGTVSDHPMRASAIPWILAGHELHHVRVLQDRYLGA